jgi:hypothetical protein
MKLRRTGDWIEYSAPGTDQTFFYNQRTHEFQWTDPVAQSRKTSHRSVYTGKSAKSLDSRDLSTKTRLGQTGEALPSAQPNDPNGGSSDWSLYEDPASGHVFWYNSVTQVSQWECPFEIPDSGTDNDYGETVAVVHEDELGL